MRYLNKFLRDKSSIALYEQHAKKSYSQCGEDLIIKHVFQALDIENPSFIDIGAHHPYYMNNTALFSVLGSKGINIEPDPSLFNRFPKDRPNDVNLNIGISDTESIEDFYIISVPTLNTFSKETALSYESEGAFKIVEVKKIKTKTIQNIIEEYANGVFPDFLSLDAEGVDELILRTIDFEVYRPIVICVETLSFSDIGKGIKNNKIIELLENKGYLLYADTNINSIFIDKNRWG